MMIDGVIYVNNVVVWLQSTTNLVILMKYVQYGRMYIYALMLKELFGMKCDM